jgi:hypothetical protein
MPVSKNVHISLKLSLHLDLLLKTEKRNPMTTSTIKIGENWWWLYADVDIAGITIAQKSFEHHHQVTTEFWKT